MTLQERILEAVGERGLPVRALYARFSGDSAAAVDFAIRGLTKDHRLEMRAGVYTRITAPSADLIVRPSTPEPTTRKCQRCGEAKPLETYGIKSPSTGARLKTCAECLEREAARRHGEPVPPKRTLEPVAPPEAGGESQTLTFRPDLISRLIAWQKAKAEEVQRRCDELSTARQELADIEELVRSATAMRRVG